METAFVMALLVWMHAALGLLAASLWNACLLLFLPAGSFSIRFRRKKLTPVPVGPPDQEIYTRLSNVSTLIVI